MPSGQARAVWDFLQEYLVEDTTALKRLDPDFTSFYYVEDFTDTYYDTPELQMLAMQSGVRHRRRINVTNPNDRKSGRELMQIAYSMRPILTIRDLRKRIYILRNKKPFMSISHDSASSEMMWAKFKIVEIEPELNEIAYTEADSATRAYMEAIGAKISAALMAKFPDLKRDLTPKYNKAFNAFEAEIPFLRFLVKGNMNTMDTVVGIAVVGSVVVAGGGVVLKKTFSSKRATDRKAS